MRMYKYSVRPSDKIRTWFSTETGLRKKSAGEVTSRKVEVKSK